MKILQWNSNLLSYDCGQNFESIQSCLACVVQPVSKPSIHYMVSRRVQSQVYNMKYEVSCIYNKYEFIPSLH